MYLLFVAITLLCSSSLIGQVTINIKLADGQQNIVLPYKKDSLVLHTLKFYLSAPVVFDKGKQVWSQAMQARLFDYSDGEKEIIWSLPIPSSISFDSIAFNIGTDSILNTAGVLEGDLSPLKGMYWSWQSGYVNTKIEGHCAEQPITLHLGGYLSPFCNVQRASFTIMQRGINLVLDLKKLYPIVCGEAQVMRPSSRAVLLSKKFSTCFKRL